MTFIVHISDLHFGTEIKEAVQALETWIGDHVPDLLVLSGDITQRARDKQFAAAAAFMKRLPPCPRIVVPGNHDIPLYNVFQRFLAPYANYDDVFPQREGFWSNEEVVLIGFDTTTRFRHSRGELSSEQIERRFAEIDRSKDRLILACIHQPLDTALTEDRENKYLLVKSRETARMLEKMQVDVVLSGHVHVPLIATTRTAFPELKRHFILSGAGTAVSNRLRSGAPNSFNVIQTETTADKRSVTIREYRFDLDGMRFVEHFKRCFVESDSGWVVEDVSTDSSAERLKQPSMDVPGSGPG